MEPIILVIAGVLIVLIAIGFYKETFLYLRTVSRRSFIIGTLAYIAVILFGIALIATPRIVDMYGSSEETTTAYEIVKLDGNYLMNKSKYNSKYVHIMSNEDGAIEDVFLPGGTTEWYRLKEGDIPRIESVITHKELWFLKHDYKHYRAYIPEE